MVPFDSRSAFVTSGIRLGVAAITTRGFKEVDCLKAVEWIDAILSQPANEEMINTIRKEVNKYMDQYPLY